MDTYIAPRAALPGFIARKVIAADAKGRSAVIVACRAEVDWALARWRERNPSAGISPDLAYGPPAEAARVLNAWGHLQPTEHRIRATIATIRARAKHGWDVSEQEADLRWYLRERRKQCSAFNAAAEVYHRERRKA